MIEITASFRGSHLILLESEGHSDSGTIGTDLICAGVSTVLFGLCNAIYEIAGIETVEIGDNRLAIAVENPTPTTDTVMSTGLYQLLTIAESNKKYVRIEMTEV